MASDAQQYLRVAWWLALFPGIAIVIAVVGVNLVVDGWQRRQADEFN
jgi:peptide/nickel transport system permease protein